MFSWLQPHESESPVKWQVALCLYGLVNVLEAMYVSPLFFCTNIYLKVILSLSLTLHLHLPQDYRHSNNSS